MQTSIILSEDVERRLDFLVNQTGRSKTHYLNEIIERGIDNVEDYYLAADVLERVRKGKERVYSNKGVRRSLDLDN